MPLPPFNPPNPHIRFKPSPRKNSRSESPRKNPKPRKIKQPKPRKIKQPKPRKIKQPKPRKIKQPKPSNNKAIPLLPVPHVLPQRKLLMNNAIMKRNSKKRFKAILENSHLTIKLKENTSAHTYRRIYYLESAQLVTRYSDLAKNAAVKYNLDPDLIKAIMWEETTNGWGDVILMGYEKTIRPMNIHAKFWNKLGISRKQLRDPKINIDTGAYLLSELWKRTENPTIEKVATLYQNLGAYQISHYGKNVSAYYTNKPWEKLR